MTKFTIEASNRVEGKNVLAGSREVEKPETVEEAVKAHGGDAVLKGFWKSYVIEVQAQIRSGSDAPTTLKTFKALGTDKQDELLKLAKEMGIL